jgi:hypothetical protein
MRCHLDMLLLNAPDVTRGPIGRHSRPLARAPAFALGSGKLLTDFLEGNSRHCLGFDDTQRLILPVGHDAKVAGLGRWPVFRFEGPRHPSSRPLRSDKNELCELICTWFVVVEVEGLVEASLNITSDDRW